MLEWETYSGEKRADLLLCLVNDLLVASECEYSLVSGWVEVFRDLDNGPCSLH